MDAIDEIDDGLMPVFGGPWDGERWVIGPDGIEKPCNRIVLEAEGIRIDESTPEGKRIMREIDESAGNLVWAAYRPGMHMGKQRWIFAGFRKEKTEFVSE